MFVKADFVSVGHLLELPTVCLRRDEPSPLPTPSSQPPTILFYLFIYLFTTLHSGEFQ